MADTAHHSSLPPGPVVGAVLYLLLAGALAVAFLGDHAGFLPPALRSLAPIAFGLFLVLFAVYRFFLVRAGRYPMSKALFQLGAGALFFMVLFYRGGPQPAAPVQDLGALLDSPDATVRQLACEVARYRPEGQAFLPRVRAHAQDEVREVRAECAKSVLVLSNGASPAFAPPPGPPGH